jgi:Asp-tRNA(Asn)/Glu-tRNA(Gln) amidotransferase A subunit family amidase
VTYRRTPAKAPHLKGGAYKIAVNLLESPKLGRGQREKALTDFGAQAWRAAHIDTPIAPVPSFPEPGSRAEPWSLPDLEPTMGATRAAGHKHRTTADYYAAYKSGDVTPVDVAERVIAAQEKAASRDPSMHMFIATDAADLRAQAEASAARWKKGEPLSVLDGVPVAVKDELDQAPYPTTVGTQFLGTSPADEDATTVARFREAGALLIGKTNMHEIGLGVTGLNPHHGVCRNPWDPGAHTGGSSSGPAAAVAAGLCPIAVGADGGGSIRTPASFCGVVGLKATFGRVSEHGAAPLCWSVAHVGPIAGSARDCAIGHMIMSGVDSKDPNTSIQPVVDAALASADDELADLKGIKLGLHRPWFSDAQPDVVAACDRAVDHLKERGAEVVEFDVRDIDRYELAHLITILSEMTTAHARYANHRTSYGLDVRMSLAIAQNIRSSDYVQAQRYRADACAQFAKILSGCDAILTPTNGCGPPSIPEGSLPEGEGNLVLLDEIMRFVRTANFTGLPAITFPAGTDKSGRPVGLMAMGRPWEEALLLRLALAAEDIALPHAEKAPAFYVDLLEG